MDAETLLARHDAPVRKAAEALRTLLRDTLTGIEETPDESAGVIGYGYGPGYKGLIATIILSKKGVKLGLRGGASLPDPDRLPHRQRQGAPVCRDRGRGRGGQPGPSAGSSVRRGGVRGAERVRRWLTVVAGAAILLLWGCVGSRE
jgi:hypothetical protein